MNILITAASRKVALVNQFKKALNKKGKVITTDTDRFSPALYFSDKHFIVPMSRDAKYLPVIKEICKKEDIKLIIPTIDEELTIYAANKNEFSKIGVTVLVSNKSSVDICNDKLKTYIFFKNNNICTPLTVLPDELNLNALDLPLFIKPRFGRGSINSFKVSNKKELECFLNLTDDPVIQTFAAGTEYTIDVLSDFREKVISVVPRERIVIRSGVSDRGKTVMDKRLIDFAVLISERLKIIGPCNIQCMVNNNTINFIEINPRFSGGIQLTFESGADFAKMIIKMLMGEKLDSDIGNFKDGLIMTSYEQSIFL